MALKILKGKVVGVSGQKTLKVEVVSTVSHPLYRKILRKTRSFLCHNEMEGIEVGAEVEIVECRPYSKLKSWKVCKLVSA